MTHPQQCRLAVLLPVLIVFWCSLGLAQANQVSSFEMSGSVVGFTTQSVTGTARVNRVGSGAIAVEFAITGPLYGFHCDNDAPLMYDVGCYVLDGDTQTSATFWGALVNTPGTVTVIARNPNTADDGKSGKFQVKPPTLNLSLSDGELGPGEKGTGTVTTTPSLRQSVSVDIRLSGGPGIAHLTPPYTVGTGTSDNKFTYEAANVDHDVTTTISATLTYEPDVTTAADVTVYSTSRPPSNAATETSPGCSTGKPQNVVPPPTCSNPISLVSGNTYIPQTDIAIPGVGGGLRLQRVWNSMWPVSQAGTEVGMFGRNWRSNFEERVFVGSDGTVKYARGDGSFWSFGYDPNTGARPLIAPADVQATLATGASYWTLTFKNGEKRLFANSSGSLIDIIDRNGNATQLSYDGMNRLAAVTDAASRHLYFSYPDSSTYQVTAVTSDFGMSLSYGYDSQQRLTTVTKPDSTTLSFDYNSQSLITAVRDSAGKVLESHTYDSLGRGLTGSRANGVEAVTVTYPQ